MNKKTKINKTFKPIYDRINCNTGLCYIDTPEETRLIREIALNYKEDNVYFWSIGQGLHLIDEKRLNNFYPYKFEATKCYKGKNKDLDTESDVNALFSVIDEKCRDKDNLAETNVKKDIYILRDLTVFLDNPIFMRRLKDLIYLCSVAESTIIICGFGITVPNTIEKDTFYYRLPFPNRKDIKKYLINCKQTVEATNESKKGDSSYTPISTDYDEETIINACIGLTEDQILNVIQYSIYTFKKIDVSYIIEEKRSIINKNDILEFWPCDNDFKNVGGFSEYKKWIDVQKTIIFNIENARKFHAEPPKALLMVGVSGSGKTLTGKATANALNTGLIKFDISKIYGSLMGQSEQRARQALRLADEVGGVMIIDELEKGLSGAGSSDKTDGGTTNRVIGTFLTWLNEEHPNLLLIATANDIRTLLRNHPELFRSGRFDKIWFSDVPGEKEREEIFAIHLKKKGRDPKQFNLSKLAKCEYKDNGTIYSYTGADIEIAIRDAFREVFSRGKGKEIKIGSKDDVTEKDIIASLKKIIPITKIGKENITVTRKWAEDNATNVSNIKTTEKTKKSSLNFRNDTVKI